MNTPIDAEGIGINVKHKNPHMVLNVRQFGRKDDPSHGLGLGGATSPDASPLRLAPHEICFGLDEALLIRYHLPKHLILGSVGIGGHRRFGRAVWD